MHHSKELVQGLWIGTGLTTLERLSISSFLAHGHAYHLYAYDDVKGVPEGAVLKDASEILPRSEIFRCQGSYAVFADLFRYYLLLARGGWWVDSDIVAMRAFEFTSEYVFASERDKVGRETVTNCVMKAPLGCNLFISAIESFRSSNFETLPWAASGPGIMHKLVFRSPLSRFVQPADVFCPIDFRMFVRALLPVRSSIRNSFAVHFWNELWRRMELDKDAGYAPASVFESLKRQYLSDDSKPDAVEKSSAAAYGSDEVPSSLSTIEA